MPVGNSCIKLFQVIGKMDALLCFAFAKGVLGFSVVCPDHTSVLGPMFVYLKYFEIDNNNIIYEFGPMISEL